MVLIAMVLSLYIRIQGRSSASASMASRPRSVAFWSAGSPLVAQMRTSAEDDHAVDRIIDSIDLRLDRYRHAPVLNVLRAHFVRQRVRHRRLTRHSYEELMRTDRRWAGSLVGIRYANFLAVITRRFTRTGDPINCSG